MKHGPSLVNAETVIMNRIESKSPLNGVLGWLCLSLFFITASPTSVFAETSNWAKTDHTAVRLISAARAVGDADTVALGLQFELKDGWKIYWRSPGDAGFPPRIDWSGSTNLAGARISWPAPVRFSVLDLETVGYKHEVVLPITALLQRPGEALQLHATVDYLACSDICVPYTADLTMKVPAGPANAGEFTHLVSRYNSQVPQRTAAQGVDIDGLTVLPGQPATTVRLTATSTQPFSKPDAFLEGPAELAFGAPTVTLGNGGLTATLDMVVFGTESLDMPVAGTEITATLVDGDRSVERRLTLSPPSAPQTTVSEPPSSHSPVAVPPQRSFLMILGLGLLGGLILNLMPCVLPVLSIKLLGVVSHGGGDPRSVRLSFIASALGILFSFMVLAAVLAAMKTLGGSVNWGIQFQQPWFLIVMILVMTVFTCNLWGFLDIRLPKFVADAGVRSGRVDGLGGHFLTGALATLLATPCSAPFLGTAIGFALARGATDIFAVFAALGLGLAAPYLAVAAFPRLATMLPRPGRWMTVLRYILGAALAATGAWLLTVLAVEVGDTGALIIGMVALSMALAICLAAGAEGPLNRSGVVVAAALAVGALLMPVRAHDKPAVMPEGAWTVFDEAAIPGLVAEGRVVFVNVTAEWCITCQANQTLVLSKDQVRHVLGSDTVVAMRGDWTRPDPAIANYLASFGRYGIPFDAVYGPGLPDGEALPELLTTDAVLGTIERAADARQQSLDP